MVNKNTLKKFQSLVLKNLTGEWVIIGGAVLHLLQIDERITLDIDLARKSGKLDETTKLMTISEQLGLSPYGINQAGTFFLKQIPDWDQNLITVAQNKNCRLLRPNGTLYLLLKIKRMSESDLSDCLQMIRYCKRQKETVDQSRLRKAITQAMKTAPSEDERKRLQVLEKVLI